ncbi:hypothetical protein [Campylobacter corcagiensis]|uniref:Uncharacterized protein n=2 Tax=Campylobacter corcagiensis TaxID=1448857 RepID=A0A7M1LJW3_9BACT|nr:hypothetical protein [Campylobacter corcagiensis]QKF63975.1 hypothetical protein CCORG_0078 [Campylobacter corcagiensis]QOQ87825.1 hypothetical protein IMC76_03195 [Campylobacter corcagiensis]
MEILSNLKFDMVVASSFGCFYALHLENVPKILINPCLHPSVEIPKLTKTKANFASEFSKIEKKLYSKEKMIKDVFGIFGNSDELFSYLDEFKSNFSFKDLNYAVVNGKHKISKGELEKGFIKARDYFNV